MLRSLGVSGPAVDQERLTVPQEPDRAGLGRPALGHRHQPGDPFVGKPPESACSEWRLCVNRERHARHRSLRRSVQPHGAVVLRAVPGAREAVDGHHGTGVGSVDEPPATDIDADVADAAEEDEVARLELCPRDVCTGVPLGIGGVRKRDSELGVDIGGESRAVESSRGAAAPDVRGSAQSHCVGHGEVPDGDLSGRRAVRRAARPWQPWPRRWREGSGARWRQWQLEVSSTTNLAVKNAYGPISNKTLTPWGTRQSPDRGRAR